MMSTNDGHFFFLKENWMQCKEIGEEESSSLTDTLLTLQLIYKKILKVELYIIKMVILFLDEEPGIFKKGLEKIKKLVNPLAGLYESKTTGTSITSNSNA